jgi:hypothetical protein
VPGNSLARRSHGADWNDLKNRLDPDDRRFFAFFHPQMPDEPLIFVQVALTRGLPAEIGPLLDPSVPPEDAQRADTATFYSISSGQPGLTGISLGGLLIKHVVDVLAAASKGAVLSLSRELGVQFARQGRARERALPRPGRDAAAAADLERDTGRRRAPARARTDGADGGAARDRERGALPRE